MHCLKKAVVLYRVKTAMVVDLRHMRAIPVNKII